ncbi:DEAD/DEAH box helicase-like protein [Candidatus Symbiobacter mobilis]|uniref:DEAD/DEAH box helicase-like protein n=1 Tax=Candidatus Symbiobacter mobilis CR TaxID=946483 RepID=U5N7J6_9BURK|nr:DEAD/DEAH box helicase-like protein [Candidatus Symbiobacter mobilis]AGX87506.1 DEAD/DEAH box helicase-like protein [Candidatus Symbiobacter mobilis CR]
MEAMAGALLDAQVDWNPHQIDAAMLATSNPLSKGVILADEVGLGKTAYFGERDRVVGVPLVPTLQRGNEEYQTRHDPIALDILRCHDSQAAPLERCGLQY